MRVRILACAVFIFCAHYVCGYATDSGGARRLRPPTISPGGGAYTLSEVVDVTIRAEKNATIIYTLDGRLPSESYGIRVDHNLFTLTLPLGDVTLHAVAVRPGFQRSPVRTAKFSRRG